MTRFFMEPDCLLADTVTLTGENAQHAKVLRIKPGEEILICDGQGMEYLCALEEGVTFRVIQRRPCENEAAVKVSVYMAFPKADKLEHVIQKATELGVWEIVAFPSARCVSRPDEKSLKKKQERWQKIAASAAEQSGRGIIPQVVILSSFREALERGAQTDLPIMFYENEHATTLKMALEQTKFRSVSILSGPEGGLEEKEVQAAQQAGFRICTLGRRILRCETAPLCGLSAIMFAAGEF